MALDPLWSKARKILCIRLDSMGDVLMTTPAIRALKETLGAQITLLTSPSGAEPASYVPEIDQVIAYESPWMKASPARESNDYDQAMIARLKDERFDGAVIFTVYSQSPLPASLLVTLAEIPLKLAHCRENPYHLLSHWVKETEPEQHIRHEVQRQLDLVASLGCRASDQRLSFRVPEESCLRAEAMLRAKGVDLSRPWMALHPGVTAPSRQYSPEGYAQAAATLRQADGVQVVFTGSVREAALVKRIQGMMGAPSVSLAGELALDELAAVIKLSPLLVANNTGPVHLAAALGTPVVDLYALTNPQHTPWGVKHIVLNHDVPCKYCYKSTCPMGHHHCLELVKPEEVVAAARSFLSKTNA